MRGCKLLVLMGVAFVTPAMAWNYVSVGVSYGHGYVYNPPVVVSQPVVVEPAPVVVEPAPVVVAPPAPVVVAPAPVYTYAPPVYYSPGISVGFSYWGGRGHCGPYYRGWHGGGYYHGGYRGGYRGGHGTVVRVHH